MFSPAQEVVSLALRKESLEGTQLFFLNVSDTRVTTRFLLMATVFQAEKPAEMTYCLFSYAQDAKTCSHPDKKKEPGKLQSHKFS